LLSYPPQKQIAVIAALHDLTGSQAPIAVRDVERLPLVLRRGVDSTEAERVRRLFENLGEVEIRVAANH
jgi:hypothetical protein